MAGTKLTIRSDSTEQTAALARRLGRTLVPGQTVLLSGPIGAGKTHFARSVIQSLLLEPEEVPSPTFTLVQTYDAPVGQIWHADLYRLSEVDELVELGLDEAFEGSISLVEWPDRLGDLRPETALEITLQSVPSQPDSREICLRWSDPQWDSLEDVLRDI